MYRAAISKSQKSDDIATGIKHPKNIKKNLVFHWSVAVDLSDIHLALIHSHSKFYHVFLSLWISLIIFAYDILLGRMCCNLSNMQSRHRYGMGSTNLTRPNAFWSSTTLWTEPYGNVMADIPTCHIRPCQITYLFAFTELDNRGVYSPRYPNVWCLSECYPSWGRD